MSDHTNLPMTTDTMRFAFVEMLFALAISQVAISTADLVTIKVPSLMYGLPALSHLLLALTVIATSWVGWRQSQAPGAQEPIRTIFSRRFIVLLVDVGLVILYFILVRRVEMEQEFGRPVLGKPSASPEAYWLSVIFMVYLVWDIISDVFSSESMDAIRARGNPWSYFTVAGVSGASSFLCLWLCRIVAGQAENVVSEASVTLLDLALLFVVIAFRVLKVIEMPLARRFGVEWHKAFTVRRPVDGNEVRVLGILGLLFLASLVAARVFA